MVKAGLIVGVIALILGTVGGFIMAAICIPCVALFAGVAAGYLAGRFDQPLQSGEAVKRGAGAGAIGGVGALGAHFISGVSNALYFGPEGASNLLRDLGIAVPTDIPLDPATFYASTLISACCLGVFEIALMAAMGAVGGIIWYQTAGRGSAAAQ